MPELPEVETVVNHLSNELIGKIIFSIDSPNDYMRVFHEISLEDCNVFFHNQVIDKVWRRGKYIIFSLTNGFLCIHLRMTGKLLTTLENPKDFKYVSAEFTFSDQSKLYFKDVRKFGRIYCTSTLNWLEEKLGIEPLSAGFTPQWLLTQLNKKNRKMKALLLDQSFIAGLGNIYIDEALWRAGIHPGRISSTLTQSMVERLHFSIIDILHRAIEAKGTTFLSFSYGENGKGEFIDNLQVFGKQGLPCPNCNTPIVKKIIAQRGTHFCPSCQISINKLKESTHADITG